MLPNTDRPTILGILTTLTILGILTSLAILAMLGALPYLCRGEDSSESEMFGSAPRSSNVRT